MIDFDFYIHGTPNGHQIWGSHKNHDYINTFYNHDTGIEDSPAMQIDICMGDSYYTYIRKHNVYDSNDRPGSFFALTVSFKNAYCSNVYKLYQIFDAIYKQVCIGSLISQQHNKEKYLISDFKFSQSGKNTAVDTIHAIFIKNINDLIKPFLLPIEKISNTFDKTSKKYSLFDVDSPSFIDSFRKNSIIVLPNLEPASTLQSSIAKQLNILEAQKNRIEEENNKLQSNNTKLENENKSLLDQLQSLSASYANKDSSTIKKLKADLEATVKERDVLKSKLDEAKSAVDIIDKPFQKLTRLMAGRFLENNNHNSEEGNEPPFQHDKKNQRKLRNTWVNSVLLSIIVILCFINLYFVISSAKNTALNNPQDSTQELVSDTTKSEHLGSPTSPKDSIDCDKVLSQHSYDNWGDCIINIQNGGDSLNTNKTYTLKISKNKTYEDANVPDGTWSVSIVPNQPINDGNSFKIPKGTPSKTNVLLEYIVNNSAVITRTVTIK